MRHIYDNPDPEQGPTIISDEAETLTNRLAAAFIRNDTEYAFVLAQQAISAAFQEGADQANKTARDYAEEENRRRAEFDHGEAEFQTRDGLVARDRLSISRVSPYPRIWKRQCITEPCVSIDCTPSHEAIPIRVYELTGISPRGLPLYVELP